MVIHHISSDCVRVSPNSCTSEQPSGILPSKTLLTVPLVNWQKITVLERDIGVSQTRQRASSQKNVVISPRVGDTMNGAVVCPMVCEMTAPPLTAWSFMRVKRAA